MKRLPSVAVPSTLSAERSNDLRRMLELAKLVQILCGCYRKDEVGDPEVYTASVVSVLSAYSLDVARRVCDPRNGLPVRSAYGLPSIAEIKAACEQEIAPLMREQERQAQIRKQLAERDEPDRSRRLSVDELKVKYGDWTKGEENSRREIKSEDVGRRANMFVGPELPNWPVIKEFVETANLSPLDWRHGTFKSKIDNTTHVGLYVRLDHHEKLVPRPPRNYGSRGR